MVIFGETHLRRILSTYVAYYNRARPHVALHKDAPSRRAVQQFGSIVAIPFCPGYIIKRPDMIFGKDSISSVDWADYILYGDANFMLKIDDSRAAR